MLPRLHYTGRAELASWQPRKPAFLQESNIKVNLNPTVQHLLGHHANRSFCGRSIIAKEVLKGTTGPGPEIKPSSSAKSRIAV